MKTIKEKVVSFDTAKLAKEKGFEDSIGRGYGKSYYTHSGKLDGDVSDELVEYFRLKKEEHLSHIEAEAKNTKRSIPAPTQSLLQKWLRDVHQIIINVSTDCTSEPKYVYEINVFKGNPRNLSEKEWGWYYHKQEHWGLYYTYENALEEGLEEALNLIGCELDFE